MMTSGFLQVHPAGCFCELCRPPIKVTTNAEEVKKLEKFLNTQTPAQVSAYGTWKCPGCLTWYGPTIGFCNCQKKQTKDQPGGEG